MEKKQYIAPMAQVTTVDEEMLMAGSINLDENGGQGSLNDDEVNGEGMSRQFDDLFL